MELEYIAFPIIGALAFFLKGFMGVGTATVVIALSSFIIEPKMAVVLAAFVNIFAGLSMLRFDAKILKMAYWIPIAATMILGSVIGAIALKYIDVRIFEIILGGAFLITSIWMIVNSASPSVDKKPPEKASLPDHLIGTFSGFCGGFIGLNAVPMITWFSKALDKKHLRRLFVLIYLPAAIAQTGTFALNGLLTKEIIIYGLLMLPLMVVGLYLGNKAHHHIPEIWFRRVLGIFLVIVSIRLIL